MLPLVLLACCLPARAGVAPAAAARSIEVRTQPALAASAHKRSRVRKSHRRSAPVPPSNGTRLGLRNTADDLALKSSAALVVDQDTGETLVVKNPDVVLPIASLTKLMTALVVIDAKLPMDEVLDVGSEDVDTERRTHSRLAVGTRLTRDELLLLALMASENRAAMALSRHYPGGREAFVAQMNLKAKALGMSSTRFADPAGLSNGSVSTARDLHRLLSAAYAQPLIRSDSTQTDREVLVSGRPVTFNNTNRLVRSAGDWDIELQKTGFTNEAGRCLVMEVSMLSRRLAMIFLDSTGTLTRYADAARVRRRLELEARAAPQAPAGVAAVTVNAASQPSSKLLRSAAIEQR
ncbi:MAG: D-alanyl-D-alanine endopeptidase [Nevskia sp.]